MKLKTTGYEPTEQLEKNLYYLLDQPDDMILSERNVMLLFIALRIIEAWKPVIARHVIIDDAARSGYVPDLQKVFATIGDETDS